MAITLEKKRHFKIWQKGWGAQNYKEECSRRDYYLGVLCSIAKLINKLLFYHLMVDNDIYNNQAKYRHVVLQIDTYTKPEKIGLHKGKARQYFIRNPANLTYFKKLFALWDMQDISYVRRLRLTSILLFTTFVTAKDLKGCNRDDINEIVARMHEHNPSAKSKTDFIKVLKYIWKHILPETDAQGRPDDTVIPYVVRHLSAKIDKSREKLRHDKLTLDEIEKIVQYFSNDVRIQAYLTLAFESLGRPQELLYLKIRDVELYDNYAKIWISEHGKEGTGFLHCIDSFPYISKWYNQHPLRHLPDTFLFINLGVTNRHQQMTPFNVNKKIREACQKLGIQKPITCYSLKRNGVTYRRLRGDSDVEIQHVARWTSTKQLKTYDLSNHEDSFKVELIKRGLIAPDEKNAHIIPDKKCGFCGHINGIADTSCRNCLRPLNRQEILKKEKLQEETVNQLQEQLKKMKELLDTFSQDKSLIEAQAQKYLQDNMPAIVKELVKEDPALLKQALSKKH